MYLQVMASRVCSDISTGFEVSREKLNKSLGEVSNLHQATDCSLYKNIMLWIQKK